MAQQSEIRYLTPPTVDVKKKKYCRFKKSGIKYIDDKDPEFLKKLAYPIDKKSTGFYQLIEFKAEPATIAKLEVNFRRDERVLRYLTVKLDKYAAEYAVKRRAVRKAKQEERAAQEAAAQEAPVAEEAPKADAPAAEA